MNKILLLALSLTTTLLHSTTEKSPKIVYNQDYLLLLRNQDAPPPSLVEQLRNTDLEELMVERQVEPKPNEDDRNSEYDNEETCR